MSNRAVIILSLSLALAACREAPTTADPSLHIVSVKEMKRMAARVHINASGVVTSRNAKKYFIEITLPTGISPDFSSGAILSASKVYSKSANLKAKVIKVSESKVEAEVVSELHDLRGHNLIFEVPVKSSSLFSVPIASVVSPRGTNSFVFVVKDGIANSVGVTPIQVHEESQLLVYAKLNEKSQVVTEGLENLLNGDKVKIFEGGVK